MNKKIAVGNKTSTKINRGKKFPTSFGNLFDLEKAING